METRKAQLSAQITELENQLRALRQELAVTPDDAPAQEGKPDFSGFVEYLERSGRLEHSQTETAADAKRRAIENKL